MLSDRQFFLADSLDVLDEQRLHQHLWTLLLFSFPIIVSATLF